MSSDSDVNESDLFCSPLISKRKATDVLSAKCIKQAKISLSDLSTTANTLPVDVDHFTIKKCDSDSLLLSKVLSESKEEENLTIHVVDPVLNETSSSYFNGNNKSVNYCILCENSFKSKAGYLSHMKLCSKKCKLSTGQLLNVLNLQKKQLKEKNSHLPKVDYKFKSSFLNL